MEQEDFDAIEELQERCGEIFLSVRGNLIFICSICDYHTKDFDDYTDHISSVHYTLEIVEEGSETGNTNLDWQHEDDGMDDDCEEIEIVQAQPKHVDMIDITTVDYDYENVETLDGPDVETKASEMEDFVSLHETVESMAEQNQHISSEGEIEQSTQTLKVKEAIAQMKVNDKRQKLPLDSAERKHKCPICGFGFRDYSNLQSHIRRHSDDKKNHVCPHCSKRFYSSTELVSHTRRHTNERPYLCTDCGRTFVTQSTLTSHTKRHLNIRNSVCSICNKRFYDNTLLKEHMITHNGQRSFQCDKCDAKFARRKALICHSKLHENKREYQCDLCPASFNQGPGLYSHLRNKHQLDKSTISNYRAVGIKKETDNE